MILDVPYYSQFNNTQHEEWKNSACGIACLKMVLDFYQPAGKTIDELYQKGLEIKGYLEGVGWYHHSLVNLAQTLGFKGTTRSWNVNQEAVEKLHSRGFRKEDIKIMEDQQTKEAVFTLKTELEQKHPVIIPLPKGLKEGGTGHLVVLIGYDQAGFFLHDPDNLAKDGQSLKISYQEFNNLFPKRAIFIYP